MYINFKINKGVFIGVILTAVTLCFSVMYSGFVPQTQAVSATEESIKLPIIMYHSISKDTKQQGKYVIDPSKLEDDLIKLKENGYTTITIQQLIDYTENKSDLPSKPIILTFDDGYYNNYCYGFPLLKENNMKAVISPIGKYSDLYSDSDDRNPAYAHIGWDEIKEMIESGLIEFQNHSYDLHHNTNGRTGAKKKTGESEDSGL